MGRAGTAPAYIRVEQGTEESRTRPIPETMNDLNAVIFALIGFVMELLPVVFPGWFPSTGGDQSSARALWLDTMGAVQAGLGLGYIVRMRVVPAASRMFAATAGDRDSLALPNPRGVAGN